MSTLVKAAIYEMGLLFNQQPSPDKINAYAKALENFTPDQIVYAFNQVINSGSAFFPSLAEILKHLKPKELDPEDRAIELVDEIYDAIEYFGYMRSQEAFDSLSEDAQLTVRNPSFMQDIGGAPRDQIPTMKAQLRRAAKAAMERKQFSNHNSKVKALDSSKVLQLKKSEMNKVDFKDILPGGNNE